MPRPYEDPILSYSYSAQGTDRVSLRLRSLYCSEQEHCDFLKRWQMFLAADDSHSRVFSLEKNVLSFRSTSALPQSLDSRLPLLLLSGNPAPHSVFRGAMYSYEGKQREHRMWRILRETELFDSSTLPHGVDSTTAANRIGAIRQLQHQSVFRLGMASFYSMPSSASAPIWSGVAGLERLLGKGAFALLTHAENKRISQLMDDMMPVGGIVISFQKNVYESLRRDADIPFSLSECLLGNLLGRVNSRQNIVLASAPPTRLLLGKKALITFSGIINRTRSIVLSAGS